MTDTENMLTGHMRDMYHAFCSMRNDINEIVGDMPSHESSLLNGPEMVHECVQIVEAVQRYKDRVEGQLLAALKENTDTAQWLGTVLVDTQITLREYQR